MAGAAKKKISVEANLVKTTAGAVMYLADESESSPITNLYLRKAGWGDSIDKVRITVEEV